jgi:riboflavin-specific deaminase-like protein
VAILGQSLDGFIATRQGQSRYINGDDSLVHLHRLRALSDAVVIGVATAVADGPRLTTRHVPGPDATRVVIDPRARLPADSGLLRDGAAPTLIVHAGNGREASETRLSALASILHLPADGGGIAPARLVAALAARGLTRLLVEGGGVTVGRFLEAGLLHRLQLAVSPLILGAGRPALPVAPVERLDEALRPACRHYRMGEDVLFDLHLRPRTDGPPEVDAPGQTG